MKKSIKIGMISSVLIAASLPLISLAQPQVGDLCSGLSNEKEHHLCSIPLIGQDSKKVYTYAITYMNIGNKTGAFYPQHLVFSMPNRNFFLDDMIAPGKTKTMIVDSHYCTPSGEIKVGDLALAGTGKGWNRDLIQMQITEVKIVKSSPLSAMNCGA